MDYSVAYDSAVFHGISSLHDANKRFRDLGGLSFVENALKSLLLQHDVANLFGVALVHRHCDLDEGTVLVERSMITAPWQCGDSFSKHGGEVVPTSWLCKEGKLFPYEFTFSPYSKATPPKLENYAPFVEPYFAMIKHHGLEEFIGLRRLLGYECTGMLECTEGNVNIMFPINEIPPERLENGTDTMWFFDGHPPHRIYKCVCINTGSPQNPNHNHLDRP